MAIKERTLIEMEIKNIKIYPCFSEHPPKQGKLEGKECKYAQSGMAELDIVLDAENYLIDGYCSYLIAKEKGLTHVPVRYGERQVVKAYHKVGGKQFVWELPAKLIGKVVAGDKVVVHTKKGIKVVTVAAVEEYKPLEYAVPLKKVIRCKERKGTVA